MDFKEQDISHWKSLIETKKIAENTDGYILYREILNIRSSFLIYFENKRSLKKLIKNFNYEHSDLENTKSDIEKWRKQRILVKEIYNLISSAQCFLEHIDIAKDVSDISVIFKFFRELRNKLVHHSSFDLTSIRVMKNKEFFVFQSMDRKNFKEYLSNKLTSKQGKPRLKENYINYYHEIIKYIDDLENDFNFEEIIDEYCNEIDNFYNIHLLKFVKHNSNKLKYFRGKVEEAHKYVINLPINKTESRYLKYLLFKAN